MIHPLQHPSPGSLSKSAESEAPGLPGIVRPRAGREERHPRASGSHQARHARGEAASAASGKLKLLVPTLLLALAPALKADPPVCQVFCVTTQCSHNSDCTAAPHGVCNLACPGVGCCVYS